MTEEKRTDKHVKTISDSDKETVNAIRRLAATADGVIFLRWLMRHCGFKEPSTVVNLATQEVIIYSTIHNESKRGVWLDVRKLFSKKQINIIEMET